MQRILLLLCLCLAGFGLSAQVVLEDFEDETPDLPWNAYEGTFTGRVANPDMTTINPSEWVGSYTKAGDKAYSYFVAELEGTLDLSENNQFSIQVYAGAPTQLIMKLEQRGGGQFIEKTVNIATANVWRTYTFDFSAAADLDQLNNLILFFDPGTETSTDTYLFDNIVASPEGPCAGTVADATIIDDFECQRNATYGVPGFDDLMTIVNPDKSGINTSDSVGQYTDQDGAFHALVIDYSSALDLSVNNRICMKVWAPVAGEILFKLEGGTSPAKEVRVMVSETETWTEVCANFSDQSGANHKKIVLFFNVGVEEAAGDVYYIDDITRTPAPPAAALEDFEGGAKLSWTPLNGNTTLNGTFNGPITNPDKEINTSNTVGSYTRGSSMFSTLTATLPNGIDLSSNPQLNLDVWAPADGTVVTLQLVSATSGPKSASATVTTAQTWQTLNFNFEEFDDVTDFGQINIQFAPDTDGTGMYLFDNLTQGQSTVDACADVEPDPTTLDDFECQRNATYSGDAQFLTVVDNPDAGANSPNQSTKVGKFEDQPGAFNALVIEYTSPIDLSLRNQFSATVWAPVEGQLLFKLEGGIGPNVEKFVEIDTTEAWSTYTVDFSDAEGGAYTKLVLFFGAGTDNATANTYYLDDLGFSRAPYASSCISTFDDVDYTLADWRYFANGAFSDNDFIISDNPNTTGINESERVGTFEEAIDGETFAGMYADLEAPIVLTSGAKFVTMKVLMDFATSVVFKLERGRDGAPGSGDVVADYTTPGEWQELTFDMSALPDGAMYDRITIIMNNTAVPTAAMTYYFDDIAVGGGDCGNLTSLFAPVTVASLRVFPNPITDWLTIENADGASSFTLTNMLGQQVARKQVSGAGTREQWDLSDLAKGTYLLTAQDRTGRLVARSMVIKR
ncbi:T9SS type A sorting domain-containing protein [Lewinella sp. JB7]|uniref:T9SS type A sorting domain-containing protein n=1 Tax=Lewinella sp. JB7 TaxID=2962887 RepID=UPI0020C94837|nr:T9SS type A sorting domain-containing protein [Lewinella sp. JB7]MCP9236994.1 T9SS type A sorting domain-containing protein [Lewinella sp. JB7]